ncbi:MAG: thioredoxin domain-containing protein, partial [Myxococcota bacterium]|nr:thioredoxin domain-containing protein [Myxococcota bacterium]
IKSHAESTPSALATEAAAQLGKGWDFLLETYAHYDSFSVDAQADWAKSLGLDVSKFNALVEDPKTRAAVVASKKEGLTNGVESTPTFFINGRMLRGAFDAASMVDMLEEELGNQK